MRASRTAARWLLAAFLIAAGTAHFVVPAEFHAQTPAWMPQPDLVVAVSGVAEILLGVALLVTRSARRRRLLGRVVAVFFVVIWVGNIDQAATGTDGFGLTSDGARWARVAVQPVLIAWAVWATGGLGIRTAPAGPCGPGGPGGSSGR